MGSTKIDEGVPMARFFFFPLQAGHGQWYHHQ